MQPGQFLVNLKFNTRMKILGRAQEIIFTSSTQDFTELVVRFWTEQELEKEGWSLLEEPWVPKEKEPVWMITDGGGFHQLYWEKGDPLDEFRLSVGNIHRTREDAELYKQKLIERMGRKEN